MINKLHQIITLPLSIIRVLLVLKVTKVMLVPPVWWYVEFHLNVSIFEFC